MATLRDILDFETDEAAVVPTHTVALCFNAKDQKTLLMLSLFS